MKKRLAAELNQAFNNQKEKKKENRIGEAYIKFSGCSH
jgi:hypothetical protein